MKGGPKGVGVAGAKPKNFKTTVKKLFRYTKSSLPAMIIAVIFSIASVILVLNIPNILADATDTLIIGAMKKDVYSQLEANLDKIGIDSMEDLATVYPTFGDLAEAMKNNPSAETDELISKFSKLPEKYLNQMYGMKLDERPTIDVDTIFRLLIMMIILIIISAGISYIMSFILASVSQKVSYKLRSDIDQKINKLPVGYFDKTSNGDVLSLLTNDVDTISTTLNETLTQLISSLTMIIGVLVMMIRINLIMTGMAILIVPISLLLIMLVVKKSQKHFINQQKYLAEVNGHIEEMFAGHIEVELFNHQPDTEKEFIFRNEKLRNATQKSQFLSGLMMPIMNFVGNLGYVASCIVGGILVIKGSISIGNIQAFIQYLRNFNQPLAQMANITNTLQSTVAAAERVFNFVEAEEEKETGDKIPENVVGNIEFSNVSFGYNADKIIIHNFSSSVTPGSKVAIVGPTGAGKTTMVKLLMRYYELNGGEIKLDGVDIKEFSRHALRENIGMVLQDTWLFNGTIMENIRYGRTTATDEEVYEAAKLACADHFIRTLDGGYSFIINEEAGNISAGQKQLLTIARAILSDSKVLILDEATSSVDTRTEILIQRAMNQLMKGKTSFIIAHRLSTIKDADKILVMRDGDIVEQGTHDDLIAQKGFYETLYNSQFANGGVIE